MAQEGIATLPQNMAPQESQGIGAFNPAEQAEAGVPDVTEKDRFGAVMMALERQHPDLADKVEKILDEANLSEEQIKALSMFVQYVEKNKQNYKAIVKQLEDTGEVEPGTFPPEYNEEFMVMLKMVIYGYELRQEQQSQQPAPFKKGGLAEVAKQLAAKGRGGDTILAHINPQEAALLKRMGGSGTINPATGLMEFKGGIVGAITGAVSGAVKSVAGAVGSAVKSVVGAVSNVLGPEVTSLVATVGGFMIGGPAGAALAQGIVTYGQGGSLKDALLNAATAYIGGSYGPVAGAAAGAGSTLLKGGSLKDAIKTAAISGAMSYGMQQMGQLGSQGQAPVSDLSTPATVDASGNVISTPSNVSATDIAASGGSIATTGDVSATNPTGNAAPAPSSSGFGIDPGPAPQVSAPLASSPGSLNLPSYDISANMGSGSNTVMTPGSGISPGTLSGANSILGSSGGQQTLGGIWDSLKSGNLTTAGSQALDWMGQNKLTTAGLVLAGTGAMGGFKPVNPTPPGIVDQSVTGQSFIDANPAKYITQNLPGVNYTSTGNIDFTNAGRMPGTVGAAGSPTGTVGAPVQTPIYGNSTYTPPANAISAKPTTPIAQPYNTANMYNFANYNPYANMVPQYAMGGPVAPVGYDQQAPFMPGTGVTALAGGGNAKFPRRLGEISGPGTGTSDSIPAMLSDGEFVITAKAVKGIGNGDRRAGAKKLYRMMHAMEKKAGGRV